MSLLSLLKCKVHGRTGHDVRKGE